MSSSIPVYQGGCSCGAVRFEVHGEPARQGYCHCQDCLRVSCRPITETVVWANTADPMSEAAGTDTAPALRVTKGKDCLSKYNHTPTTSRYFCKMCGTPVFAYVAPARVTSSHPVNFDNLPFKPTMHVNCTHAKRGSLAKLINDGLPKYKGFAPGGGGTGELID